MSYAAATARIMPSRQQLLDVDRPDLVHMINKLGGFAQVSSGPGKPWSLHAKHIICMPVAGRNTCIAAHDTWWEAVSMSVLP